MKITKTRMRQIIKEEVERRRNCLTTLSEVAISELPDELQDVEKEVITLYKKLVGWSKKTAQGVEDKEAKMTLMKVPIAIKIAAQNIAKIAKTDNEALLAALGSDEGVDTNSVSEDDLEPTENPEEAPKPNSGDENIKARELEAGDTYQYTSKKGNNSVVKVEDPNNDVGAVVLQKVNPEKGCKPAGQKFATNPETFASAIDDEVENCEIPKPEAKQAQRHGGGKSRGKQVSPNAAKKRKAKQKQQKVSRKKNRPGNRQDDLGISETLEALIRQAIDEEVASDLEECGMCSTCGDPSHDHTHDAQGIRITIGTEDDEEYEIDPGSLI